MNARFLRFLFLAACTALITQAALARPLLALTRGSERIEVETLRTKVVARVKPNGMRYRVDSPLAQLFRRVYAAEQVLALEQDGTRYFVILTRELSRPHAMGRGQCGGGEEHNLVLLAADADVLSMRDQLLVASCFRGGVELVEQDGGSNGTREALKTNESEGTIGFSWLADGPGTEHVLSVEYGRFSLRLRPLPNSPAESAAKTP